jgi:two-component system chemotaxis sensor kinase CheA
MSKKKDQIDKETKEIIDSFVSEGYDLLEDAEEKIINLDNINNKEVINTIFRMFHSIKGSAGYLNFENIKQVTHEAETLLDIFRKQDIKPNQETIDLLYQTVDFIRQLIVNVEKELSDEGFEDHAKIFIHNISQSVLNIKKDLGIITDEKNIKPNEKDSLEAIITPEMHQNYISEATEIFDKIENKLLILDKDINNLEIISDIFRDIHTLKGNSGIFGYNEIEKECSNIESFLDSIRKGNKSISHNFISTFLKNIDIMRSTINMGKTNNKNTDMTDKINNFENPKPLGEILIEIGAVNKEQLDEALKIQNLSKPDIGSMPEFSSQRKDVRIDTDKLDFLFNTVGELVTTSAMVVNNPDLAGLRLENFKKAGNSLLKITRDLKEVTMSMRMVPVDNLFIKMKRLVRDLSNKFNKVIQFNISGEDTEMDRNVIEQISDPLIHILRNAVDHGIESREKRIRNNKSETGRINLKAKYEGNEIWIIIEDDGAGLNRDKIIKKAIEKGLLKTDVNKMTDDDIWQLIFLPGFSTVDTVSDVSGRGVGMDVVKKNIEKLKGTVSIESEKNKGTKFTLKIPLTLAMMEGITFKIGSNLYSIPTIDIQEFFQADFAQITKIDNNNLVLKIRDEILPVIKLFEVFNVKTNISNITDGIVIVVKSGNKKACLLVDEIIGNNQIVVKSLSSYLGEIKGICGCSIMGNGEVCLIIDSGSLLSRCIK